MTHEELIQILQDAYALLAKVEDAADPAWSLHHILYDAFFSINEAQERIREAQAAQTILQDQGEE